MVKRMMIRMIRMVMRMVRMVLLAIVMKSRGSSWEEDTDVHLTPAGNWGAALPAAEKVKVIFRTMKC